MYKVLLQPLGTTVPVPPGGPLLPALLGKKLNVAMSCGGNGICSTCHVRVRDGMDELSPMEAKERRTLALVADADPTSRLACQTHVRGDGVVLELPRGMYIETADDLLGLLGTRAPENILHPIRGHVLIPQGKIITRTLLEQSRSLDDEVRRMKDGLAGRPGTAPPTVAPTRSFAATGRGVAPPPDRPAPVPLARPVADTEDNLTGTKRVPPPAPHRPPPRRRPRPPPCASARSCSPSRPA